MAKRRKRKMKRSSKIFFVILFCFIAIVAVLLTLPFFNITSISVSGISRVTEEEVIAKSGIMTGENVFRTSTGKAQKRIERIPFVDKATVTRKFPARIEINIVESSLAAKVLYGEEYIGIDQNGKVVNKSPDAEEGVLTIFGLAVSKSEEGEKIEYESEDFLKIQSDIFDQLQKNNLWGKMSALNLENRSFISMSTFEGLDVYIGTEDELDYKFKLLASILDQGYTSGVFDITNTSQPTFRKNK